MKKQIFVLLLAGTLLAAAGCGKKDANSGSASAETEAKIVYSDDNIDLAEYKNLSAEKNIYTVTQDDLDDSIQSTLSEYAEFNDVDRAAKSGDYVTAKFTGSVGDETIFDYSDDEYEIILGDAEYGLEFDDALIGAKSGDTLDFSVSYTEENATEDNGLTDLVGETVAYHVEITGISEQVLPEYTDMFVQENLDADSMEAYEQALKESLEAEYSETSDSELQEALLNQVIEKSTIKNYSDELYQSYYDDVQSQYQSFADAFGVSLEDFGLTDEDLQTEALDALYRDMIIATIAEQENLTITDEEYETGSAELAEYYEYESVDALLSDADEDTIRQILLENEVLDLLVNSANITETPAEYMAE